MLNDLELRKYPHIYIAPGYTDMRQGINSLSSLVQYQFRLDPLSEGSIFLFCGRKRDRIKVLTHDQDGYVLLYKRLFKGRYQWPMSEEEVRMLTPYEFRQLLGGYSMESSIDTGAIIRIRQANRIPGQDREEETPC
ncbi:MAG: IS66 family insertion sequence element accessory protein TnpB [Lachnospiraceae bacterium]|nr:IS66 family insertion sequence element accessory protein TnpB [Eubacterium sp.]MBR3186725.1 IS66 family insertion sequence element accessory protein TnpB [Lachnospiraceae bacterium]